MQIAIDGPAGAGKSTVAKLLAASLNAVYVDTGAMYRALAWKALQNLVDPEDETALRALLLETAIDFAADPKGQQVFCDGQNVTAEIRTPEVTHIVPKVAVHPQVREIMVERQQSLAKSHDVIMDGRDIGEKVLPNADFKFFVTAAPEERARRRVKEFAAKNMPVDFDAVLKEIRERDDQDMHRSVGALKILPDSIQLDTTGLTIEEVIHTIKETIGGK